jgi:soluble lytic murein transglycosylase-like protein
MRRAHSRSVVRRDLFVLVLACLVLFGLNREADAGIFVCRDSSNNMHFTNLPESGNCVPFRKKRSMSSSSWKMRSGSGPKSYESFIAGYGKHYRVDPNLIKAVIQVESGFDHRAVSRVGAQGLMQLMPATALEFNVLDPFNPRQNIEGGTRYLRYLLDTFNGDLRLALAAYNAGPTLVKKVNRIPRIPETENYVKRVIAHYQGFNKGRPVDGLYRSTIKVGGLVTVQ